MLPLHSGSKWYTHVSCLLGHRSLLKMDQTESEPKMLLKFQACTVGVWCQHSGYSSGRQLAHPQDFCQRSMSRTDTDVQSLICVRQSHALIHHHTMNPSHLCLYVIISALPVPLRNQQPTSSWLNSISHQVFWPNHGFPCSSYPFCEDNCSWFFVHFSMLILLIEVCQRHTNTLEVWYFRYTYIMVFCYMLKIYMISVLDLII